MRSLILFLLVFCTAGCIGYEPLIDISTPNPTVGVIDLEDAPPDIVYFIYEAVELWDSHGLHFAFGSEGWIHIHEVEERYIARWTKRDFGGSDLSLSSVDYGYDMACIAAHYLGFSIRLHLTPEPGLTGNTYLVHKGQECPWTEMDRQKVCSYLECKTETSDEIIQACENLGCEE